MEGTSAACRDSGSCNDKRLRYAAPHVHTGGFDYAMALILAVLEKRRFLFFHLDAYLNVVGGLRIDEPAVDLAVAMALVSSLKDATPIRDDTVVFGEIICRRAVR